MRKCPQCNSTNRARIIWGLPHPSRELQEGLDSGKLTLEGCLVSGDDPKWECNECGSRWK